MSCNPSAGSHQDDIKLDERQQHWRPWFDSLHKEYKNAARTNNALITMRHSSVVSVGNYLDDEAIICKL